MTSPARTPAWMAAPTRHHLVGVHALVGLLAEELLDQLLDLRHPRLTSDEDDLVDVGGGDARVLHRLAARLDGALDEVGHERLELRPGEGHHEVLGARLVGGDERQVDLGLDGRAELDLRLLRGLLQALQRHAVTPQVDAVLLLELLGDPVDHALVEVVAPEVRVAVRRLDFEDALADLQDRDVERPPAQVVHGDLLVLLLVETIGQGGGRGLVDDAEHLEPGDLSRVLGGLALAVVEVGGHGDHGLADLVAEIGLRRLLQLAEDHPGDLGRRVLLASNLDADVAVGRLHHLVGDELDLLEDLVVAAAHEPLDGEHRVLRVRDGLTLRDLADEDLAVLGEGDHRGSQTAPLLVGDDHGAAALQRRDDGVRGAEVDADHLAHGVSFLRWPGARRPAQPFQLGRRVMS